MTDLNSAWDSFLIQDEEDDDTSYAPQYLSFKSTHSDKSMFLNVQIFISQRRQR